MLAGLRSTLARLLATGLAVALSVGFVVATLTLSATFVRTTEETLTADMAQADLRVTPTLGTLAQSDPKSTNTMFADALRLVRDVPGVAGADVERLTFLELRSGEDRTVAQAGSLLDSSVRWQELDAGAWPAADNQVALDGTAAESLGITVGSSIQVAPAGTWVSPLDLVVVGITTPTAAGVGIGAPTLVMMPDVVANPSLFAVATGILISGDGTPAPILSAAVTTALAGVSGVVVQDTAEAVDYQTGELSGSASVITSILLSFAIVALFVSSMVVANTFHVLVTQRTRELGLLRCVGASAGQIRRLILGEAAILGVVSSALGVAAGIGGSALLSSVSTGSGGVRLGEIVVDPALCVIGFAAGLLMTLVAALSPARRATRVRPIEALRISDAAPTPAHGMLRLLLALALIAIGGFGLVTGATDSGLPLAVASGVISFLGVLLASSLLIPWIVRAAGASIAWTAVPARLAALNATRNPVRTASTAAALLVGVTLVTMMAVGVTSVRVSINDKIDQQRPVDLVVATVDPAGISAETTTAITALPQVVGSSAILAAPVNLNRDDADPLQLKGVGLDPVDTLAVARSDVPVAPAGTVLLNPQDAEGITAGQGVAIAGPDGSIQLAVGFDPAIPRGQAMLATSDFTRVAAAAVTSQVQLRLADEATAGEVQVLSTRIMSLADTLSVEGGAPQRIYYEQILDVMLLIVLSLLTIAVVIAVVGVANTLALSVIERRRESALLRALGLSKGQLRRMLGTEAVLITAVAGGIGIALGVVYAWAGLSAVALEASKLSLGTHLPWQEFVVILLGAVLAGIAASIVPAHRAAKQSPMEALAVT